MRLSGPPSVRTVTQAPSAEQNAALEAMRKEDLRLYMKRVKDFDDTIRSSIQRAYNLKKQFIEEKYRSKIEAEERLENEALQSAIAYFEKFLAKYPDDPPYTPDAMFRLAELYYDVSYLAYVDYLDEYDKAVDAGRADDMPLPQKDFSRSVALFQDLIARYPDYENVDGAYYLLGYCLKEMGREEEARLAWLNLVCGNKYTYDPALLAAQRSQGEDSAPANPSATLETGGEEADVGPFVDPFSDCRPIVSNTRFFFETWWLIGNYHFDYDTSRYGVERAIAAYKKLVEDSTHKFYDKGLYKLAWSYYKADRYPEAIENFSKVVEFSDQRGVRNSSMRPEAIQYLAVCFFTEDWDGDMVPDSVTGLQRIQDPAYMPQDRPWTKEVYARLGDIYADNEKHEEAIAVWKLYIEKWPLDKETPFIVDKIANSYQALRQFDEELAMRSRLDEFGKDSPWWKANEDHPDAQVKVLAMAQDALINAAITHHQNAQVLRAKAKASGDPQIMEFALDEYKLAAEAYRKYLDQNPDTPDAYDLNFQLADALFWSGNYEQAKVEYEKVRDSNLDDKYLEDAARMVIISLERILEQQVTSGAVTLRDSPPELSGDPPAPTPIPLPPLLSELMAQRERYLEINPGSKDAATFDYQSAQNYYRYGYWDEARKRYDAIYNKYCGVDEVSVLAWKTLLNIAVEQNDLDTKERLAQLEQKNRCAEQLGLKGDEGIELDTVLGDVAMQRAMQEFKRCVDTKDATVCSEAGDKLVAAVGRAPDHPSADAALHNAALAYENAQRNKTAMEIYGRIVEEYPQSQWVDKCLFKKAFAANAFFEYEEALASYQILADEKRFADSEYRADAVLNTALILTNLQDYKKAVDYWKRYAKMTDDPQARIEADFNAADMYFRAKMYRTAIDAYAAFIRKYRSDKEAGPFVVKAAYRTAASYGARHQVRQQVEAWKQVVSLYEALVNEPGSISAEYAAECAFKLAEREIAGFEKFSIKGSQKQIEKKMKEGAEKVKKFEATYKEIQRFRRPVWSLAAEVRIGFLYEVLAKAILNIPPPPLDKELQKQLRMLPPEDRELVMMEYEDKFRAAMEQHVSKMEERAQAEYKLAIEMARAGNIHNEWSAMALERMNAYDPDTYPRQHDGIVVVQDDTLSVPAWAPEAEQ